MNFTAYHQAVQPLLAKYMEPMLFRGKPNGRMWIASYEEFREELRPIWERYLGPWVKP